MLSIREIRWSGIDVAQITQQMALPVFLEPTVTVTTGMDLPYNVF